MSSTELISETGPNSDQEKKLYEFLVINYLLMRCGCLSDDMKEQLDTTLPDWIDHVETSEDCRNMHEELPTPLTPDACIEFLKFREFDVTLFIEIVDRALTERMETIKKLRSMLRSMNKKK